jgi:2-oxoglutarate dehydrogenase E2 component (dihydrolipoamide succinyltransferase)
MTVVDVVVPSVGESVSEGSIGRWFRKDGEIVKKDEPLFELDSDKASMEVTAASGGRLKILAKEGQVVTIGATVAKIETDASGNGSSGKASSSGNVGGETKSASASVKMESPKAEVKTAAPKAPEASTPSVDDDKIKAFSPSRRRMIRHGEMNLSDAKAGMPSLSTSTATRTPMNSLRKTIAQRLMYSQQSTATLTTFNEIDMTNVMAVRNQLKDSFQAKHGVKLGFMSFFSAAVLSALKTYPIMNKHIDGTDIVDPNGTHLGIAVSTERGLVVPVIRDASGLSYAQIEKAIAALAEKARDGKLSISEMQGGTFTITNGGVFGSLLSTPILNPPQSGILGMHKTEHRAVAIEKDGKWTVEVRPMMYVALSYDHRLIDGATSVGFLVKVKEYLETLTVQPVL